MPNFYFIDTNLIFSYCNPFDSLNQISIDFFQDKDPYHTFLLFSVQEEFYRKVQDVVNQFSRVIRPLVRTSLIPFKRLEKGVRKNTILNNTSLTDLFLNGFTVRNIKEISHTGFNEEIQQFNAYIRQEFNTLIIHWIKRPHMSQYATVLNTKMFNTYNIKLKRYTHFDDAKHLALASYEVRQQNKIKSNRNYFFYTYDKDWILKDLETKINISNLNIKIVPIKEITSLPYNKNTKRFERTIIGRKYISDGL